MSTEQLTDGLPVTADDRSSYYVWDLREWSGDVETLAEINEAWMAAHEPAAKTGTISVFPDEVVLDGELQGFISEGWNEAAEAVGLEHLAIVGTGLQTMAVESQIDAGWLDLECFETVPEAVDWMDEQVS
jgi:hypothetical protein